MMEEKGSRFVALVGLLLSFVVVLIFLRVSAYTVSGWTPPPLSEGAFATELRRLPRHTIWAPIS